MSNFADCFLTSYAEAPKAVQANGAPIVKTLGRWRGAIRKRRIARMEHHVAVELGYTPEQIAAGIDWSKVNWPAVIAFVVKVLLMLLPLLIL